MSVYRSNYFIKKQNWRNSSFTYSLLKEIYKPPLSHDLACLCDCKTYIIGLKCDQIRKKYLFSEQFISSDRKHSKVALLCFNVGIVSMYYWQLESADSVKNSVFCQAPKLTLPEGFFTFAFFSFLTLDYNNFCSICSNEVWFFVLNRGWKWLLD